MGTKIFVSVIQPWIHTAGSSVSSSFFFFFGGGLIFLFYFILGGSQQPTFDYQTRNMKGYTTPPALAKFLSHKCWRTICLQLQYIPQMGYTRYHSIFWGAILISDHLWMSNAGILLKRLNTSTVSSSPSRSVITLHAAAALCIVIGPVCLFATTSVFSIGPHGQCPPPPQTLEGGAGRLSWLNCQLSSAR